MSSSAALSLRAPAGDHRELTVHDFRSLYDTHVAMVVRTLRRFGVPDAALDDATQDVFTVVHGKLERFEGRSTVRTWIFGIARRVARNHRPPERETLADEGTLDYLESLSFRGGRVEEIEQARLLYRLLGRLTAEQREVFLLVELEQFSVREASEITGENPNTLSSRLRRTKQDLMEMLERADKQDERRSRAGQAQ